MADLLPAGNMYVPTGRPRGRPRRFARTQDRLRHLDRKHADSMKVWNAKRVLLDNSKRLSQYIAAAGAISYAGDMSGTERERLADQFVRSTTNIALLRHVLLMYRRYRLFHPDVPTLTIHLVNRDQFLALDSSRMIYRAEEHDIGIFAAKSNDIYLMMNSIDVPTTTMTVHIWVVGQRIMISHPYFNGDLPDRDNVRWPAAHIPL